MINAIKDPITPIPEIKLRRENSIANTTDTIPSNFKTIPPQNKLVVPLNQRNHNSGGRSLKSGVCCSCSEFDLLVVLTSVMLLAIEFNTFRVSSFTVPP